MTGGASRRARAVSERWDQVFRVLSAEPRRQVIFSLMEVPADQWLTLPDAAESPNFSVDRECLRIHLWHRHLPMLADAGYVHWKDDPFSVHRGPAFEEVAVLFEALQSTADDLPEQLVADCPRFERERRDD